jgi:diguanylate cyclase (GGDEF)-like protein/PAS domain S-box-containing protein
MKFASETALHHKFLENMHDAVLILDKDYKILDCNHVANIWYGYTADEIKTLNLRDVRAPESRDAITSQMQGVAERDGATWETVHMRKDGSTFPVEVSSTPIVVKDQQRFYHVVRDISVRKKTELALRASEERYRIIVEDSPYTIFIHRDGKIIFMNAAGLKLFGATDASQIVGQSLWILYPPERHGIVRARNQTMEKTRQGVPTIEHTVLRLDGMRTSVEATACLIEYDGSNAFYVIMHDISSRKKTQLCLDMQYAVSHCLVDYQSLVDATRSALDTICNSLNFVYGKIWAWDKKDQVLRYVSSWRDAKDIDKNADKVYSKVIMHQDEGLPAKVMTTGGSIWIEDLNKESGIHYPEDFKYASAVVIPIKNERELLGVMEFVSSSKMSHDEVILQALSGVGEQVGSFLKRKKFEKDLDYLAKHDPITGLSNRDFFEESLAFEINLSKSRDKQLAVLFLDIDSFQTINEGMGHAAGDQLLRSVALRFINIAIGSEKLGRFGPQFAIILNEIDKIEDVNVFIDKILECIAEEFSIQDQILKIQFNIGIALYPSDGHDVNSLMRSASIALTSAKNIGGGSVQFCTAELKERAKSRIKIESDLHSALENQEFFLYYQPIIEIPNLITNGFESLIRWNKNGRVINPMDFILIAEKTHLIIPIGEWIIRTACEQCKLWQKDGASPVSVSVNISPVQFKHSGVIDILNSVLQDTGLDPGCLKVEITESAIMDNAQKSIDVLKQIKDMGIKISIDDFGTGYSSLNYLRHLPIDFLKIDQSFVRNMTNDTNDAAIVKTIIELADNLGYKVIAEGVETQAQLNFLSTLGCHFIQGYYFSKPLLAADATEFLKQGKLLS